MRTRIVIECSAPTWAIPGVKEDLAMYLEKYGDCSVLEIAPIDQGAQNPAEQAKIPGFDGRFQRLDTTM